MVDGNTPASIVSHHAQIIDAVTMVGMIVGVEHAVEHAYLGVEELLAKIGRSIHEQRCRAVPALPFDENRAAPPLVFRISRIARPPMIADPGHAARRAAAEDGELEGHW